MYPRIPLFGLLLALLFAIGCGGPTFVFPGGALSGEVERVPASWPADVNGSTCQLETSPGEPYSVNIACTIVAGVLYINAGDTETQWVQNIAADPAVRVRIDGAVYEMGAERVSDAVELERFAKAWTDQSMFRRDPTELDEAWVYRLASRAASSSK